MDIVSGIESLEKKYPSPVVTIGNFDGVHLGHLEILNRLKKKAVEMNGAAVVFSFKPHPRSILFPEKPLEFLSTYSERREHIESAGIDLFVEQPFSRSFSSIEAEEFFEKYLIDSLETKALLVGHDFGFGKNRRGDLKMLRSICESKGVEIEVVEAQKNEDAIISSTQVRNELKNSNIRLANQHLGYSFYYRGHVVKGDQRGRKIGFPTANLKSGTKITLPHGVYATLTHVNGQKFHSVTNVGIRPTFEQSQVVIETHLIDQEIDLYGVEIKVEFIDFVRDEQKFPSIEALKHQISEDVKKVQTLLP